MRVLVKAVRTAAAEGYVRAFLDEGPSAAMLNDLRSVPNVLLDEDGAASDDAPLAFVDRMLREPAPVVAGGDATAVEVGRQIGTSAPSELLTRKEIQVVRLAAEACRATRSPSCLLKSPRRRCARTCATSTLSSMRATGWAIALVQQRRTHRLNVRAPGGRSPLPQSSDATIARAPLPIAHSAPCRQDPPRATSPEDPETPMPLTLALHKARSRRHPDRAAAICGDRRTTYAELHAQVST